MTSSPIFVLFRRQTLITESILILGIFINTENIFDYFIFNSSESNNIILVVRTRTILIKVGHHCHLLKVLVFRCVQIRIGFEFAWFPGSRSETRKEASKTLKKGVEGLEVSLNLIQISYPNHQTLVSFSSY
jgi:hypothetical protein